MKTMRQEGILNWIYSYALKELFNSDLRSMALELRIGEGVIQYNGPLVKTKMKKIIVNAWT